MDVKKKCALYSSDYSKNEGNPDFSAVLRSVECIFVNITLFIYSFDSRITGSCASEPVDENEDIIDLKDEPVEVSYCIL